MKNKLLLLGLVFCVAAFTSCKDEEAMGRAVKGVWEGDMGITRTLRGKTIKPTRTVLQFNQERNTSTVGSGIMIEYYNLPGLEAVYSHITWNTWTRKNGNVGFEFKVDDVADEKYVFYDDWSMTDERFTGKYPDKNGKDVSVVLKRIQTMPDVSKVKVWGFFDKMDTWYPVAYEGTVNIQREYQSKSYSPTKVTIVFDIDPVYNETNHSSEGYIIEHYSDAPFGSYLADKVEYWGLYSGDLSFRTSDNTEYRFYNTKVSEQQLTGEYIISVSSTQAITFKRTTVPDVSFIQQWGITSRIR